MPKPVLKQPVDLRLKIQYDGTHSNFTYNFNLRRYTGDSGRVRGGIRPGAGRQGGQSGQGRAVQVDSIKTRVDSAYVFSA